MSAINQELNAAEKKVHAAMERALNASAATKQSHQRAANRAITEVLDDLRELRLSAIQQATSSTTRRTALSSIDDVVAHVERLQDDLRALTVSSGQSTPAPGSPTGSVHGTQRQERSPSFDSAMRESEIDAPANSRLLPTDNVSATTRGSLQPLTASCSLRADPRVLPSAAQETQIHFVVSSDGQPVDCGLNLIWLWSIIRKCDGVASGGCPAEQLATTHRATASRDATSTIGVHSSKRNSARQRVSLRSLHTG